jgi:hypothetical protein
MELLRRESCVKSWAQQTCLPIPVRRITGEHVDMLQVLEQESGAFAIDLKKVLLVDREAVKLLALSESNGTELRNCSPYIREWVTRERAETHGRPSEQGLEGREDLEDA